MADSDLINEGAAAKLVDRIAARLVALRSDLGRKPDADDPRFTDQRVPVGVSPSGAADMFLAQDGQWRRITASSGSPGGSTPGDVAGLLARFDASSIPLTDGALVAQWYDRSGAQVYQQSDSGWQPQLHRDATATWVGFSGTVALDSDLDVTRDEVTVAARIWVDDTAGIIDTILTSTVGGALAFRLDGGHLEVVQTSTALLGSSSTAVQAGAWVTVAWRVSLAAGKVAFFVDGSPAGSANIPAGTALTKGGSSTLGYRDNGESLTGRISWWALYDRALTDAEVAQVSAGTGSGAATSTATTLTTDDLTLT